MYVNARAIIERPAVSGVDVLVQTRVKPGQLRRLEFPGGQVEEFESVLDALRREVSEETGLDLVEIEGQQTRVVADDRRSRVECVRPFAVYQTLHGPVDSMGVYFRCRVTGELSSQGDAAKDPQGVPSPRLQEWLDTDPDRFSWVDRAGLQLYLDLTTRSG